jgi:chromosomal replication initiator protein
MPYFSSSNFFHSREEFVSDLISDVENETELWYRALAVLQERIKPHNFDMWLRPIICHSINNSQISLIAPNLYIKEWFEDNYLSIILEVIKNQTKKDFIVSFSVSENLEVKKEDFVVKNSPAPFILPCELNEKYTFDSFIVGPSNQLAHAASMAVSEYPAIKYNPLFIYGGVGLGKTHLLCAIGHELSKKNPSLRIAYLSSEKFMNEYINTVLHSNKMEVFRTKYRDDCDVLLMDDIQFIAGKDRTQDEFFHTFNSLYDSQRQIVITADKYPKEIHDLEDRLRTRFQWGLIADIQQPELETRIAILKKKAGVENIILPNDVALFLASNIKSNVRELEGSLIRLAAFSSLSKSKIDIVSAKECLKDFLFQNMANISIESIQKEVSTYFGIKISEIKGAKRHKAVSRPRQIAMFLCRKLTKASFPEIGQRFGGKDHSTVISACKKIESLIEKDLSMKSTVEIIEKNITY